MLDWTYLIRVPVGLAVVVGLAALVRHRRRSRPASRLALAALFGVAVWWLLGLAVTLVGAGWINSLPIEWRSLALAVAFGGREVFLAASILVLVWAVLADRRGGHLTWAEADYEDAAEPCAAADPRRQSGSGG
jgi:hypothetical protein